MLSLIFSLMPMPSAFPIFLVVQILILAVQIILHFPKKNLDVQKKFGRPKNFFFIVFSYEIDVFG